LSLFTCWSGRGLPAGRFPEIPKDAVRPAWGNGRKGSSAMGRRENRMLSYELRFRTKSAVMRAFREIVSSEFVEDCLVDVPERVVRFRTAAPSLGGLLEPAHLGRDLLEMRSSPEPVSDSR
jgi:hypothetical protein